jgi:hypothetical protein
MEFLELKHLKNMSKSVNRAIIIKKKQPEFTKEFRIAYFLLLVLLIYFFAIELLMGKQINAITRPIAIS